MLPPLDDSYYSDEPRFRTICIVALCMSAINLIWRVRKPKIAIVVLAQRFARSMA